MLSDSKRGTAAASIVVPHSSHNETAVTAGRQIKGGRLMMLRVGAGDHAEAFEFLEVAVDGRDVDVRGRRLNLGGEFLRVEVSAVIEEGLDQ